MRHQDFAIGQEFETETGTWRCTDVGTRTVVAIKISAYDDPSWFDGPPYAVVEVVFDEDDMEGETCWRTRSPKGQVLADLKVGRDDDATRTTARRGRGGAGLRRGTTRPTPPGA